MFTSRAEYRLSLRADNADQRLTPMAEELGIICKARSKAFAKKMKMLETAKALAGELCKTPNQLKAMNINVNKDGVRRTLLDLLAYPNISMETLIPHWPELDKFPGCTHASLEADALYAGYIKRQAREIAAFKRDEGLRLPEHLDYGENRRDFQRSARKISGGSPCHFGAGGTYGGGDTGRTFGSACLYEEAPQGHVLRRARRKR